jgi:potassium-dependent mechanosensitive channel
MMPILKEIVYNPLLWLVAFEPLVLAAAKLKAEAQTLLFVPPVLTRKTQTSRTLSALSGVGRVRLHSRWRVVWCSVILVCGLATGFGQTPLNHALATKPDPAIEDTNDVGAASDLTVVAKALNEKLTKARADLAVLMTLDSLNGTNTPSGAAARDIALRRGLLERLVRLYEQQMSFIADLEAARSRRSEIALESQASTGFAEPRPHSILRTDALREAIQMERLEIVNGEKAVLTLDKLIEENRVALSQAEEKIRQLDEQLERNPATTDNDNRIWPRELERLRSQVASATVKTLDLERQIRQERLAGSRVRLGLLQQQLVIASASATFTDEDMGKVTERLDTEQRQLELELKETLSRQKKADQALQEARKNFSDIQSRAKAGADQIVLATEQLELCRAKSEAASTEIKLLRFILQIGVTERVLWEMRFATYNSTSVGTIRQIRHQLEQFDRRVQLWRDYYEEQMENSADQMARLEARLADLDANSDLVPLVRERLAALREQDQMLLRVVRNIEQAGRLVERLREGLEAAAEKLPFLSRLSDTFTDAQTMLSQLWRFELFVAQDTITVDGQQITGKRSVTLGKVITAAFILIFGYWLAGLVTRLLEPIFIKRFKIEANQANLIRRWLRVVLVFGLALFSLVSVKIPLTVFAFAGGALAIGLGFGLQTLLKNFVSGVIILFERPFRVGDVLDVAGQRGTVGSIGIRSCVLQLWDGTETLIPNSALLENNLTNWTYTNRVVRFTVTIGVAYGSDTRRVVQLLGEIAERHGLVEKDPKPMVLFTNFGASALEFELRFWVDVVRANSALVASDLRQMIAGTFAEYGLVIAFPQQDVHMNTPRPIQVQLIPVPERPAEAGSSAPAPDSAAEARLKDRAASPIKPADTKIP